MYRAIDIASYVLNHYQSKDVYITNLKLQKLLYFIQCEFIKKENTLCFTDDMQAWAYGPVVPEVYNTYSKFVANEILDWNDQHATISDKHKLIIDDVIDRFQNTNAWDMVQKTHEQSPWKLTYVKGKKEIIHKKVLFNFVNKELKE